ncbi:MAG: pyruvate:ferredoxin (flavodoxin) oxidoreductase [Lachnospiraceae bacterium]|nr:pyruvate:ferredoxin (flavodoxin) oxidoreductase [Lachnospiraceae bacterium]
MISRQFKTMDGNQAAAHVAYAYSEAAAIYPITPSSPMAELADEWSGNNRQNIFGQPIVISEMQSEAGAAGAVHGALIAGALATTFTSSQGLLLMIPNIYRIAGELLPGVFHVAARTIATHALSIFGDHSDIYACRQTGAALWAESSVQEVMDLTPVAHLAAIEGSIPFINFFDGFRTSHELHKIQVWDYQDLADMVNHDKIAAFRARSLHPTHGIIRGSAQNPDIFFQAREASNPYYDALPDIVEHELTKINQKLGTHYGLFDYYGAPDATHVIIAMGSVCETIKEYIDANTSEKYGLVNVHLYRPFSVRHLLKVLPESVQQITVLNRTKEPGAIGEPLYLDVLAALQNTPFAQVKICSGRYGLSSKDTTPGQIHAIYHNQDRIFFTVGIEDDVTHLSLPVDKSISTTPTDVISCKFWGFGGDGTISATKNSIKIIGNNTDMTAQGYFEYDSKKSRGLTISHLRFGKSPIRSTYLIQQADFVACHNPVYLHKYEMVQQVKDGGIFLLNCTVKQGELPKFFPENFKTYVVEHNIRLYLIDAMKIAKEIGLNGKISTILQAAFFATSGILPLEEARRLLKDAAQQTYGKKGEHIVQMNNDAIDRGFDEVIEITLSHTSTQDAPSLDNPPLQDRPEMLEYVKNIQQPITDQRGNELPVSAFVPYADGYTPPGSTAHERRNVTTEIPVWIPENCIQCNLCSYVCPHAVIRPAVMTEEERANAPEGMEHLPMMGMPEYSFAVTVSHVDCTGCGSCAAVCPGKMNKKALEMNPIHEHKERQQYFDYGKAISPKKEVIEKFKESTVKGSQFKRPLMEFSGACAGCGETPYVKLLTQLYGDKMYIANATGCSSIWANSSPSTAYTVNECGHGPAWSNSLFEDAAEFGFGMLMAQAVRSNADDTVQWVIGGDGWAYDIGFGGLDHVLASGKNINILVLDTEVYSNTGGQASKATPTGSTAKFVTGGKKTPKKDLAAMAMTYGNVYVAQIAMGADYAQTVKALTEAAAYPGPSLVIAYCTCISHGIRAGMGTTPHEERKAVETGYFHLFRFNPALKDQNKNPFILDSKEPKLDYEEFLSGEIRYDTLSRIRPEEARQLFEKASAQAKARYRHLQKKVELYAPDDSSTE